MESSSCISPYGRRGRGALWGSFNRGTNVIHEASPSWPDLLQKVFLLKLSHWWLGFNTWILGDTDIRVYSRLFVILCSRSSYSISYLLLLNFQTGINMHCFHFIISYSLLNFLQSDFALTSLLKLLFERSKWLNCQIHKSLLIILSSLKHWRHSVPNLSYLNSLFWFPCCCALLVFPFYFYLWPFFLPWVIFPLKYRFLKNEICHTYG